MAPQSPDEPMQIGVARGPLSESERDYRRRRRLCMYCGAADHLIRACPVRPQRGSGNARSRPL